MFKISKKNNFEKIKQDFLDKGFILLENRYDNNKQKLPCIDKDGYKYEISYNKITHDNFSVAKFHYGNIYTPENIQLYFDKNNIGLKIKDLTPRKIKIKTDKIEFVCSCGNMFLSTFQNIYYNKTKRCRKCSLSKSELEHKISNYLDSKNVKYIEQYTFKNCKIKRNCRFDFYLPKYNSIIEVHGEQHYRENNDFELSLLEQKERDKYKKDYCLNNNIKYLEIPYWLIRNNKNSYKNKIDNFLD